jgi:hypothetical protein
MATPSNTSSTAAPEGASLRLRLRNSADLAGIDGAWWPRSRSLQSEAADLVDNFPDSVGRISRLLFSRPDWDDSTVDGRGVRKVRAARGPVKVGSFPTDDTRLMIISLLSGRRLKLRVIPSATDPAEARQLLRAAVETTQDDDSTTESRWDNEFPWS